MAAVAVPTTSGFLPACCALSPLTPLPLPPPQSWTRASIACRPRASLRGVWGMWYQAPWAYMDRFHTDRWAKTDSMSPTPCPGPAPDSSAAASVPSPAPCI